MDRSRRATQSNDPFEVAARIKLRDPAEIVDEILRGEMSDFDRFLIDWYTER